jgi:hypothetical protein
MPSAWITHAKKTFAAGKKKSASYKFSQALKDAAKTWKKKRGGAVEVKKKRKVIR